MVRTEVLRAGAVGVVCGLGTVVAHAGAAGHEVATGPALLLTALGLAAGPHLARRPTPARLVGGALALQATGHGLLALTPTPAADGNHGAPAAHGVSGGLLDDGPTMLAGHLVVALLTALLALRADQAVRTLTSVLVARLLPLPAPAAPRSPARAPSPAPVVRRPAARDRSAVTGPRAPPRADLLPLRPPHPA